MSDEDPKTPASAGRLREVAGWVDYLKGIGVRDLRGAQKPPGGRAAGSERREPAATSPAPRSRAPVSAAPVSALKNKREDAPQDPAGGLAEIRADLGECTRCGLHEGRKNIVFGVGNPRSRLMFVGEGPGADEDAQGEPFVGRAGQKLNEMIRAMGFKREDVYIANVVKCRPPGNRDPKPDEVATCSPFLFEQIDAIRPAVIVTLGSPATKLLLSTTSGITRLRGTWHEFRGVPVMPTFHPAYLLRAYTPENRKKVWSDLKAVKARLDPDS